MSRRPGRSGLVAALVVLGCALAACSSRPEPGLFGRSEPPVPSATATAESVAPRPRAVDLPVAGTAVWTSGDGREVQLRLAVHAVRRIAGATVLDWSVTPLAAPGLSAGDPVAAEINLGLTRFGTFDVDVLLVDEPARTVYRPLIAPGRAGILACLCTPVALAERTLHIGETRLLQVAYPPLPTGLAAVDVAVGTVPPFGNVPVTPAGQVPQPIGPVDLAAPAEETAPLASTAAFRYGRGGQPLRLRVAEVVALPTSTTVRWSVQDVTGGGAGLGVRPAPPFADGPGLANPVVAAGPRLRPRGSTVALRSRRITTSRPGAAECLCSDLRLWALAELGPGQEVSLVTTYPALPRGTQQVDVLLDGLPPLRALPVTAGSDGGERSAGAMPTPAHSWTFRAAEPSPGWPVDAWPTPVPDARSVASVDARVERLLR